MKKIRWGILGSANIAVEQLLLAIQRSSNATATAIATRNNMERANEIAEAFGIEKVDMKRFCRIGILTPYISRFRTISIKSGH